MMHAVWPAENPHYMDFERQPIQDPRTKRDIVGRIAMRTGMKRKHVETVVKHTIDSIHKTLLNTGRVELRGFGILEVRPRQGQMRRNPKTGERVYQPPHHAVFFRPAKEMLLSLAELDEQ